MHGKWHNLQDLGSSEMWSLGIKEIVDQVNEHIYFHDMAMNLTWRRFFDFF